MNVDVARRIKGFSGFSTLAIGVLLSVYAITALLSGFSQDDKIQKTLKIVADWQLAHMATVSIKDSQETGWVQASFYIGLARLAATSNDPRYFEIIRKLGERNEWDIGPRLY